MVAFTQGGAEAGSLPQDTVAVGAPLEGVCAKRARSVVVTDGFEGQGLTGDREASPVRGEEITTSGARGGIRNVCEPALLTLKPSLASIVRRAA